MSLATAVTPAVSDTHWQVRLSRLQFVMYPYLHRKGKQILVFLTHSSVTTLLIYGNKIL